jgi:hypothetical protein
LLRRLGVNFPAEGSAPIALALVRIVAHACVNPALPQTHRRVHRVLLRLF